MPQTREHVAIMRLLGVEHLAIVISKIDRVTEDRVNVVATDVTTLVASAGWPESPTFALCNRDGRGVPPLLNHLEERAAQTPQRGAGGYFRLPIDRAFTLKGAGLVVTGTAASGRIAVGDTTVAWRPGKCESG